MTISKAELSKRKTKANRTGNECFISIETFSNKSDVKLHGNYNISGGTFEKALTLLASMVQVGAHSR